MRPFMFTLRPPRHPATRFLLGLAGVALLGFFTLFGLIVGALVLAAFALRQLYISLRGKPARPQPLDPQIIEGEYRVVEKARLPR